MRKPQFGDEVFIPSEHDDGHWVNGIVNSGEKPDGNMIVVATGHRYSNLVLVPVAPYLTAWCWPEDIDIRPKGARVSTLEDVQG